MQSGSQDIRDAWTSEVLTKTVEALTDLSLQSTASLLLENSAAEEMLEDYYKELRNLSAMIHIKDDNLNPRWNRTYGKGGIHWEGALADGKKRGGMPYFCPHGWVRFSLKVCEDANFDCDFEDWGYLYHGTNSKHVGSILMSGLRSSTGRCFCGPDDQAVYMSPSIEYCGHPRFGCIEYNPETRKWIQCVLQCRVKPSAVWQKKPETMFCEEFGLTCDPNVDNSEMEWLFKPTHYDPDTRSYFIKNAIVCTGIMVRITDVHPTSLKYWWSRNPAYLRRWDWVYPIIDPKKPSDSDLSWILMDTTERREFFPEGSFVGSSFKVTSKTCLLGKSKLSRRPFGKGGMRFAYYLQTRNEVYVVKLYNRECLEHITDGLGISESEALQKDVNTYLVAAWLADCFNEALPDKWRLPTNMVKFLQPYIFRLVDGHGRVRIMFGEKYVDGKFVKWSTDAGFRNTKQNAKERLTHTMIQLFCHYTWHISKGRLMIGDVQGWNPGVCGGEHNILLTDPQIHTHAFTGGGSRKSDPMYQRFSLGNLGKIGMMRFFQAHVCTAYCRGLGMSEVNRGGPVFSAHRPARPRRLMCRRRAAVGPAAKATLGRDQATPRLAQCESMQDCQEPADGIQGRDQAVPCMAQCQQEECAPRPTNRMLALALLLSCWLLASLCLAC